MTPTIHWPTDHSPITHTDPSDPPNPPRTQLTWPFLHFMTLPVCSIQTLYFLKPHGIHYPLTHFIDHFPITHTDPSDPPLHGIVWPSESRTVVQRLVSSWFLGFCNPRQNSVITAFHKSRTQNIWSIWFGASLVHSGGERGSFKNCSLEGVPYPQK